jgi:spore coat polysaccharide biosynthesis predicted glycosyltransferase SpsG
MPKIVKWLLWILAGLAVYMAIMILLPYIRFADIKGKMKEAVQASDAEPDMNIATKLAETALLDRLPIAGDYFYKVTDENGKKFVYTPEYDDQQREYLELAKQYFLDHMNHTSQGLEISIGYTVEVYFPFGIYTHKINFEHKEGGTQ